MEIRQLKYFAAVADTLNFSRAAETLFISQSALSKQIADLERELGMVLLQRDKRSVRLTPAGKVFLNDAKVILMLMDTIPILLKNTEDIEKKGKPIVLSLRHLLLLMRNLRSRGRRRFLSAGAYHASLRRCPLA